MDVKVELDKESVNDHITKAIMDSAIGDELRKEIKTYLDGLGKSYESPIKKIVGRVVQEQIYRIVSSDEQVERIKQEIRTLLTEETISTICSTAFNSMLEKQGYGR